MIIGNGDVASVLPDRNDLLFFASGVSNSKETQESEFEREQRLLINQDFAQHLVYFSSLSVFYGHSPYVSHKRTMEGLVKALFKSYTIIRLGNITWGKNPHTLINYFREKIRKGEEYEVQNTYRYIIDREEFLHWVDLIPSWSCEMNITGTRMLVADIIKLFGRRLS